MRVLVDTCLKLSASSELDSAAHGPSHLPVRHKPGASGGQQTPGAEGGPCAHGEGVPVLRLAWQSLVQSCPCSTQSPRQHLPEEAPVQCWLPQSAVLNAHPAADGALGAGVPLRLCRWHRPACRRAACPHCRRQCGPRGADVCTHPASAACWHRCAPGGCCGLAGGRLGPSGRLCLGGSGWQRRRGGDACQVRRRPRCV